ncbi:MAG TPA: class I SAM-dependent methyltransferase [Candidatus Wunengus sp. YC60]|uniref:class I SAM-dependent methyltransferase n=1 Tax=Candidatus Wunengus sp. YC60 TaxID=3367697 RepID=UPI004029645C
MTKKNEILRVKGKIKESYGKLSKIYAAFESRLESKLREKALWFLKIREGETVLEIGFATGSTLVEAAKSVGKKGKIYGLEVTPEMVELAKEKLEKTGLTGRTILSEGDARKMPYENNMFDAVYMVGVLELFDTPDIPKVLKEIKRVLKRNGRLVVASISKKNHENSMAIKIYEWIHRTLPKYASCRPIYVEDSIVDAEYEILEMDELLLGKLLPIKFVVAKPKHP